MAGPTRRLQELQGARFLASLWVRFGKHGLYIYYLSATCPPLYMLPHDGPNHLGLWSNRCCAGTSRSIPAPPGESPHAHTPAA